MSSWTRVANRDDCPVGELEGVMANGIPIVLANVDGDIYALRDECSHEEFPLSANMEAAPTISASAAKPAMICFFMFTPPWV